MLLCLGSQTSSSYPCVLSDPSNVAGLHVTERNETSLTLQWDIVENSQGYNLSVDGQPEVFIHPASGGPNQTQKYSVTSLSNTTRYSLTLFTVGVDNLRSTGVKLTASTSKFSINLHIWSVT